MRVAVGIDGGGTKTEAIAIDEHRHVLVRLTGESTNPNAVTLAGAMRNLSALLDALRAAPALSGRAWSTAALGLSGVNTPEERNAVLEHLQRYHEEHGLSFDCTLQNDAQIALMATLEREEGIIAIAGTGSIVFGLTPDGHSYRAGGWGHILGDEGSGYDIGLRTLKAVTRSYDGIGHPTRMTEPLLELAGLRTLMDLRTYAYREPLPKSEIARFAEICIRACEDGDLPATGIITQAAQELAAAALAVIGKDAWFAACDLVTTGSIFQYSPTYKQVFEKTLAASYPELKLHAAQHPPAYGAALLALRRIESPGVHSTITRSSKESD